MDYIDFVYKKWLVDVTTNKTNLSFEEYLEIFNK